MNDSKADIKLFIGSSSEGESVARNLEAELSRSCLVTRWSQGVFEPGGNALDSLTRVAHSVDFAVLIATGDDVTVSRGEAERAMRDNIVFEYGLFIGALGRERVYMLATEAVKTPSDVLGVTRLPYRPRSDGNIRSALNEAALSIEGRMEDLGPLARGLSTGRAVSDDASVVEKELETLRENAIAQGWQVKTDSATTLRLKSPRGQNFTLSKGRPGTTRVELRNFASRLRAEGLRVNQSIRRSPRDSPLS